MNVEQARKCAIVRIVAGSHLTGLNIESSDMDELGVCIEPIEEAMGFGKPFEQADADPATGDVTIYGLRKFLMLACKGNPSIIQLLFAKEFLYVNDTWKALLTLTPHILSRLAGNAFLGYLQAQRLRMLGLRGNAGHGKMRQELESKYGFDTKYAMHMLRLGIQGVELLSTGRLELPMRREDRDYLLSVRHGAKTAQDCIAHAAQLEEQLRSAVETAPLPPKPNDAFVEKWMIEAYQRQWRHDAAF